MHIGIDFDGTIVLYGKVFQHYARALYGLPDDIPPSKDAVRESMWSLPDGRQNWIALQGMVYGTKMSEAEMAPGVDRFLRGCKERSIPVSVISHKTEYSKADPRRNLRESAEDWLVSNEFFSADGMGLERNQVFFEPTREAKIKRIDSRECTHFIDDLPEVFAESSFPSAVEKLLYGSALASSPVDDARPFQHWNQICQYLFDEAYGTLSA